MNDYPIGDFNIEQIGEEEYRLILFLDPTYVQKVGLDLQLYRYGLTKARWNPREQSLEIELFYEEVNHVIDLIQSSQAMEPGYIALMYEVLANESLVNA